MNLRKLLTWEFEIETPGEDGKFRLLIQRPSLKDKMAIKDAPNEDQAMATIIEQSVKGWEGIVSDSGEPEEFTPDAFNLLQGNTGFYNDLCTRLIHLWYGNSVSEEEAKNLKPPSTESVEA